MELLDLPSELLTPIISFSIHVHQRPSSVLCVNKLFHTIGLHELHKHLWFSSSVQIARFATSSVPLASAPRTISLTLGGGNADFHTFDRLHSTFLRCRRILDTIGWAGVVVERSVPIKLDELALCLHSHARNQRLHVIRAAFALVNPKSFRWTGPNPDHHFSTAIVPEASHHLLSIVPSWTHLQHLVLTNISLGEPVSTSSIFADYIPPDDTEPLLSRSLPGLRTIYIGQATFLHARVVAAMLALEGWDALEELRLVDVYSESIWGRRMRRTDLERAASMLGAARSAAAREEGVEGKLAISQLGTSLFVNEEDVWVEALVQRIRQVVVCEARTERFMGGDRASEDTSILI